MKGFLSMFFYSHKNFYLLKPVLKFGDLLGGWKFATNAKFKQNISKIHKLGQKTQGHGL